MRGFLHFCCVIALSSNAACLLCSDEYPFLCLEQFNNCETDLGEKIGYSLVDLELRQQEVRSREVPVGNLIADAFYEIGKRNCGSGRACPQIAFENGGAIRYENPCGERELIRAGPLYELYIRQALPFSSNRLGIYDITGHDLRLALEHAVGHLGQPIGVDMGGHFLHVSRLRFEVDCNQPSQSQNSQGDTIVTTGARIVPGSLEYRTDDGGAEDTATWATVITSDTSHHYRVVTNSFIGSGNDGFIALVRRQISAEGEQALISGTDACDSPYLCNLDYYVEHAGSEPNDADAVIEYIRQRESIAPFAEGRIKLRPSCFVRSQ